ncbi:MAG: hypothetical protein G01um101431_914 [Parcubacteria group bacterium Gr01-1014_31]|nr:MAG: hypothetical protein G01um101431_914 [Parcubacteria group bacterium Gr01-1014_31]
MQNPLKALGQRFIRSKPRPTEYFVAKVVAWTAVVLAVTTSIGLMIAAVRLA